MTGPLPLRVEPAPGLPLWREADDRSRLRSFGVGVGGGLFWGGGCAVLGGWITLGALRVVPFDLSGVRVPLPVFAMVGGIFVVAGLAIAARACADWLEERRAERIRRAKPGEPALADYPWDREWSRAAPWAGALRRTFWTGFLALFFAVPAGIFFNGETPLIFRVIIGAFGVGVVWMIFLSAKAWWRAAKFGASSVRYSTFPLRPGGVVKLEWNAPTKRMRGEGGHFTLRALEEKLVRTRAGGRGRVNRTRRQLWSARLSLTGPVELRPHEPHTLEFTVPAEVPGTWLGGGETVVFWELCAELELDGLDFRECYLVPIYHAPRDV